MLVRVLGARPDELRHLAGVLRRADAEAAWLRRRIDAAQDQARVGGADTRSLLRLEAWLDDSAADVRRRAARLEEAGGRPSFLSDVHPPGISGGRCLSVLVPVALRPADGRGGDEALGEPLFAAAPLHCRPPAPAARDDDRPLAFVATPGGLVAYARRGKRGGGEGGGPGGGRPKPTKEEVLTELRLPHGKGVPFAFKPDRKWRPEQRLKWDPEQRGYVDAKGDVWRKGPSRTPGDPFEWDVQLRKTSRWQRHSKDGKHVNINLSGRISH